MRKYILLFFLMWIAGVTSAQDRRVTLHLYQSPLKVLFKEIETQCGYTFVYSDEVVSDTMRVSLKVKEVPVSKILDSVLASKQLFHQVLAQNMMVIGSIKLLQKEGTITKTLLTGRVLNPDANAVPFATIALLADEVQVNGAIANEQGSFQFLHQLSDSKKYELKVSSVGYEVLNLKFNPSSATVQAHAFGQLRLMPKAKQLNEVNVMGNQKIIEMEGSNIIFNVDRSINAQGSNALELLGRAPGVVVGNDNNISLNGKAGAAILIDGKQTYLSNREIAELLKSMSSSAIKSIEIINSPSAKYDAAGTAGIINVRTLKTTIQGFNAGFTTGFSYGVFLRNNQDLSFSYRKNRLNLYGNYNHFIGYYSYLYGGDRIQEGKFYNSFTDDVDKRKKMGSRLGADFAIDRNQTIGILLNGNFIFGGGITDTKTDIGLAPSEQADQTLTAINDYYHQKTQRYNVNLNYKYEDTLGRIFNIDADYGDYTKGSGNMQSNKYTNASQGVISDNLYRSVNANSIGLKAIKVDYATNLWKGKLETGAKYSSVAADNEAKFLEILPNGEFLDSSRSNRFAYREEIASAYINYKKELGKWQLQGGLRVENSASTGKLAASSPIAGNGKTTDRNYTNLFPFLSASIKPSASHQFSLSYSRRIDRPDYQNLNPFIYLLDELSYWQGNPFLQPQLSHRLLGQYVYKSSTIVGLSYTRTNNFSVEVTDTVEHSKIVMVPRNLGLQQHLALTLTQTLSPYKWWNMAFNGTFYHLQNDIDFGGGRKQELQQTAARLSLQQTFKLPFKLSAEILGIYNSRRLAGANKVTRPNSQVDLGLQRSLMDNKATLRLVFSDIYKGNKTISIQDGAGLYIKSYGYFESRQVKLNFSYRLSTGNNKGPRNRSSALENENGRIK